MAARYYDDAIIAKLKRWVPENSNLRVLKPDESKRLFEIQADDTNDRPFILPIIALSRNTDIEILQNIKTLKSFDGLSLYRDEDNTLQMNVIPIKLNYQLEIYTKKADEGDEYLRNFLFKLINNPLIRVEVPYNDTHFTHTANIRVANNVSDTSAIGERLFSGQFTRWTIPFEIQDAFLFSVPYKKNWKVYIDNGCLLSDEMSGALEIYEKDDFKTLIESEKIDFCEYKSNTL